ncbi:MAG: TIGR02300 family protein [Pseudomonadota bacterium]
MATKDARGTKRTCQSTECGERFYDLNRDPIVCPICGTVYEIAHAPAGVPVEVKEEKPKAQPAEGAAEGEEVVDDLEGADAIEDIETEDDDSTDDSDTFLETEDDDGGTVTDIIAPRKEGEEET